MREPPVDAGDTLRHLAAVLADSVTHLERAGGVRAELAGLLGEVVQALEAAAIRDPEGTAGARAPDLRQWLHDVREPVTAIAGWVRMLTTVPRESTRIRAVEAIERNAKWLNELLAHRPT